MELELRFKKTVLNLVKEGKWDCRVSIFIFLDLFFEINSNDSLYHLIKAQKMVSHCNEAKTSILSPSSWSYLGIPELFQFPDGQQAIFEIELATIDDHVVGFGDQKDRNFCVLISSVQSHLMSAFKSWEFSIWWSLPNSGQKWRFTGCRRQWKEYSKLPSYLCLKDADTKSQPCLCIRFCVICTIGLRSKSLPSAHEDRAKIRQKALRLMSKGFPPTGNYCAWPAKSLTGLKQILLHEQQTLLPGEPNAFAWSAKCLVVLTSLIISIFSPKGSSKTLNSGRIEWPGSLALPGLALSLLLCTYRDIE